MQENNSGQDYWEYWGSRDWVGKPDIQIAEEEDRTRERIRQIRKQGGYPECINKGKNRERIKFEAIIKQIDTTQYTLKEIAELTNRTTEYVSRTLNKLGLHTKSANVKYDWTAVDFSKSPTTIARELGTSVNYASRQKRKYAAE